jgi:hypothetical protein
MHRAGFTPDAGWNLPLIGACIACAATLVACGGGSSSSSKSAFIAEADGICTDYAKAVTALPSVTNQQTAIRYYTKVIALRQSPDNRLKALRPPSDVAAEYKTFLSNGTKSQHLYQQGLQAAKKGNTALLAKLNQEHGKLGASTRQVGAKIGFTACASKLPANQQQDVAAVIKRIDTTSSAAICTQDLTPAALTAFFGGLQKCLAAQRKFTRSTGSAGNAKSVDVSVAYGVDHVSACATERAHGGANNGKKLVDGIVYQGGRWKENANLKTC